MNLVQGGGYALLTVVTFMLSGTSAYADDGKEIVALAKKYQGRFQSEMPDQSLLEREFSVRVHLDSFELRDLRFDDAKQEISFSGDNGVSMGIIFLAKDRCTKTGSGVGKTAFGVKLAYIKQNCERYILHDKSDFKPGDTSCGFESPGAGTQNCKPYLVKHLVKFSATPSDFRQISAKGVDTDIRFKLRPSDKPTFQVEDVFTEATLDNNAQTITKIWTIDGSVLGVSWFLPGGKVPVRVDEVK